MPRLTVPGYFVTNWNLPSNSNEKLKRDSLHIWRLDLDQPTDGLELLLSKDELARLQGIQHSVARNRFLQARAALRIILAHYLAQSPESVNFVYGRLGKPALSNQTTDLQFNLSHSAGHGLLALRRQHAIGVDIESIQPRPSALRIAQRVLDVETIEQLEKLEEPRRSELFIQQWTKMEATAKSQGGGVFSTEASFSGVNTFSWTPYRGWQASVASDGPLPDFEDWSFYLARPLVENRD